MALTRYEPWSLLNQFSRELDSIFHQNNGEGSVATSDWTPSVDIKENDNQYTLLADIPGVDPKDNDVHMEDSVLTIRGERNLNREEEKDNFKRVERIHGTFYRRFTLPETADAEKISARCKDGVLEVVIPKQEKVLPRKIAVQH